MTKLARFSWEVLVYNLAVIALGAYVRATRSGAGCGAHWPLCNGELVPQAPSVEMLVEFSHRVSSGLARGGGGRAARLGLAGLRRPATRRGAPPRGRWCSCVTEAGRRRGARPVPARGRQRQLRARVVHGRAPRQHVPAARLPGVDRLPPDAPVPGARPAAPGGHRGVRPRRRGHPAGGRQRGRGRARRHALPGGLAGRGARRGVLRRVAPARPAQAAAPDDRGVHGGRRWSSSGSGSASSRAGGRGRSGSRWSGAAAWQVLVGLTSVLLLAPVWMQMRARAERRPGLDRVRAARHRPIDRPTARRRSASGHGFATTLIRLNGEKRPTPDESVEEDRRWSFSISS